jgi:hypothetical protein
MNITRNAIRSVLVATAAGSLVLGSAAGAMAAGTNDHAPRHVRTVDARHVTTPYLQLTKVDLHRHNAINVNPAATTRALKVRATVRDTDKVNDPTSVTVTLASYDKRHGTVTAVATPITVTLDLKRTKRSAKDYVGVVTGAQIKAAVGTNVAVGSRILVCIKSADLTAAAGTVRADSRQVTKKENGGDCVKVVNKVPSTKKHRHA